MLNVAINILSRGVDIRICSTCVPCSILMNTITASFYSYIKIFKSAISLYIHYMDMLEQIGWSINVRIDEPYLSFFIFSNKTYPVLCSDLGHHGVNTSLALHTYSGTSDEMQIRKC